MMLLLKSMSVMMRSKVKEKLDNSRGNCELGLGCRGSLLEFYNGRDTMDGMLGSSLLILQSLMVVGTLNPKLLMKNY